MATVLAPYRHYKKNDIIAKNGRYDDMGFWRSTKYSNFPKLDKYTENYCSSKSTLRCSVEPSETESDKIGSALETNGKASRSRMVPVGQVLRNQISSVTTRKPTRKLVNGSRPVINGTSIVKKVPSTALVQRKQIIKEKELPPIDELKVLPPDDGFSWAKEDYNVWQRNVDIWAFVISLRIRVLFDNAKWTYIGGFSEEKQKIRRRITASWVRECVLQLGPTFIKLGQLSSTRSDLFPKEFVEELAKLQDRVPAFSPRKARDLIQKEFGVQIDIMFKEFEDQPIAAASLGQVHRAVLHNGERVAVKIQRPGLKKLFDIDLQNLKMVAEYFQRSETLGGPTKDWIGIYDECSKVLYQEIDYVNEGRNADKFRRDFRNVKWVRIPRVYWDYTGKRVLTLEYVPGIKINNLNQIDALGYDHSVIASRAIEAYLIQILKTGFFHADPHPGNLAIDKDGSLIYYDFGMMGELKSFTQTRLLELFYAIYEKDADKVIKCLIDLGALQPTGDMSPVRRSVQFFLDNSLNQTPDQEQTLTAIGEDLFAIALDQPFRFPSTFTFLLRAFSTLEGIGYSLNPEFSFVKIAAPYAQELLDKRQKSQSGTYLVEEFRKQAVDARSSTISMPYRVQHIDEFVKKLEAGDLKLRVRVLEAERAARRASIMQSATIYTVAGGTLLNLGVTLTFQGSQAFANGSFIGAAVFAALLARSMQRVQKLDKFEKMI
ncbi:hypothetical protein AMTRI_Chr10g232040 [Amborella trichopoda]